ncbi:MAG: class I SAM-dependent methyltransferase [Candidatus Solibacter usitatus]|nr:class I SAM-dependent methyltransferase [Candidatus Solibacter usitatus]
MQNLLRASLTSAGGDRLPQTIAARTQKAYDRMSAVYPISTMFFHSRAHRQVLRSTDIKDGMRVLEIATGSGEMFRRLLKTNPSGLTIGGDLSPNMAGRTQRRVTGRFPHVKAGCQAMDARHLPFRDKSFDAVVCCYLLELLSSDDAERAIGEVRRVLKPGGSLTLVLIGENKRYFNRIYRFLGALAPAFWGRQICSVVPEILSRHQLSIQSERTIWQSFYPSRVVAVTRCR